MKIGTFFAFCDTKTSSDIFSKSNYFKKTKKEYSENNLQITLLPGEKNKTKQGKAKQSKAKQSKIKQNKTKQNKKSFNESLFIEIIHKKKGLIDVHWNIQLDF